MGYLFGLDVDMSEWIMHTSEGSGPRARRRSPQGPVVRGTASEQEQRIALSNSNTAKHYCLFLVKDEIGNCVKSYKGTSLYFSFDTRQ